MVRGDLVKQLAMGNINMRARDADTIVAVFFDEIVKRLVDGGRVELRGFGSFATRARAAREGRNPKTGAQVDVSARRVPHFTPGKGLRERIDAGATS